MAFVSVSICIVTFVGTLYCVMWYSDTIVVASSTKGKLGEDVGQPGILTGDTRVSHTSPKGECGTPWLVSHI